MTGTGPPRLTLCEVRSHLIPTATSGPTTQETCLGPVIAAQQDVPGAIALRMPRPPSWPRKDALHAVASGQVVGVKETKAMGCGIKFRA